MKYALVLNPPQSQPWLLNYINRNPIDSSSSVRFNLHHMIFPDFTLSPKKLHTRLMHRLEQWDNKLDTALPNFEFQNRLDAIGLYIQKQFAPLTKFNQWLDHNGIGNWFQQLAVFLCKLPMRTIRNIVRLIYTIIKEACLGAVHPLKSANRLVKLLASLAYELTQPETWAKIGVGMMGASLGQALVTGNPLSMIGLGVGGSMLIGGLTIGPLKAALQAEKGFELQESKKNLWQQLQQLPESMLTGFCMGLIMGGIQRALYEHQMKSFRVTNYEEAKHYADCVVKEHHLPQYSQLELDASGKIIMKWSNRGDLNQFREMYPKLFPQSSPYLDPSQLQVELNPGGAAQVAMRIPAWYGYDTHYYIRHASMGWTNYTYPCPPENVALSQMGCVGGTHHAFHSTLKTSLA